MRNIYCRNTRREIEAAGSAELLSAAAVSHIEVCVACERVSQQQTKLQAIVSGLGSVEVPGDFDFRLRARLANERRGSARRFGVTHFSFGFRSAAFIVIASAGQDKAHSPQAVQFSRPNSSRFNSC